MQQPRKLLETVAYAIAKKIIAQHKNIEGGKVIIQKIGPQLGGKVDKTVIEVAF